MNSGWGCKPEKEVVVLGGKDEVSSWAWYGGDRNGYPPSEPGDLLQTKSLWVELETKFNPYHDEQGRFSASEGGTFVSLAGKPDEAGAVVGAGAYYPPEVTPKLDIHPQEAYQERAQQYFGAVTVAVAKELGIKPGELVTKCNDNIKQFMQGAQIKINLPEEVMAGVFSSGQIENQIQTGSLGRRC